MKVKKAIKRLDKVDELLSNVIDQYGESRSGTRDLLDSARKSVVRAKAALKRRAASKPGNKPAGKVSKKNGYGTTRKGPAVETADTVEALSHTA